MAAIATARIAMVATAAAPKPLPCCSALCLGIGGCRGAGRHGCQACGVQSSVSLSGRPPSCSGWVMWVPSRGLQSAVRRPARGLVYLREDLSVPWPLSSKRPPHLLAHLRSRATMSRMRSRTRASRTSSSSCLGWPPRRCVLATVGGIDHLSRRPVLEGLHALLLSHRS